MQKYEVIGMNCAACSSRVEREVSKVQGVSYCSVNLLTGVLIVEGEAKPDDIKKAVINAGYGIKQGKTIKNDIQILKNRLFYSIGFLLILMYLSMGYNMLSFPLPDILDRNPLAIGIIQMILTTIVLIINKKFFTNGVKALIKGSPNMDSLVAIGSSAAFIYSLVVLINLDKYCLHDLFFESSAMIPSLITLGKMLEAYSKGKTTNAISDLIKLKPQKATVIRNDEVIEINSEDLIVNDIFIVKSGEAFPADGMVIEGYCAVDESSFTGESIPVDKNVGDEVLTATINNSGYVKCRVTKTNENTVLSQIIKMVSDATSSKAPIAKIADRVAGVFVPFVMLVATITLIIWLCLGKNIEFSLMRAISVLVISCPCALGLATPVAIMVGSGVGAKKGILFKNATSLEETGKMKIIALDKTGTITYGKPIVTDILGDVLEIAYSLEAKSEHPIAKAIVNRAVVDEIKLKENTDFQSYAGNGISARIDDKMAYGGNFEFISDKCDINEDIMTQYEKLAIEGKTPILFAYDNEYLGMIAVRDKTKEDSKESIAELRKLGIKVVMITGDNYKTANAIKNEVLCDEIYAEQKPIDKKKVIEELKKQGNVAMVGDGINDALALSVADVGIAIGAGSDIAISSADVILMKNSLADVVLSIKLSKKVLKNIHENLFWAFIYNIICIPLATGFFGLSINPMIGALTMSLSSFCVVMNALRLNNFKKEKIMEKELKIEGMMCAHCEARVKQILEGMDGVSKAVVSHKDGTAKVFMTKEIADSVFKNAIESQGYKVL